MIRPFTHLLSKVFAPYVKKEHFNDTASASPPGSVAYVIATFLSLLIVLLLLGFAGTYLWNGVIAGKGEGASGLFTTIKPASSIWQIIGIYLLILIMAP